MCVCVYHGGRWRFVFNNMKLWHFCFGFVCKCKTALPINHPFSHKSRPFTSPRRIEDGKDLYVAVSVYDNIIYIIILTDKIQFFLKLFLHFQDFVKEY